MLRRINASCGSQIVRQAKRLSPVSRHTGAQVLTRTGLPDHALCGDAVFVTASRPAFGCNTLSDRCDKMSHS